MRFLNTTWIKSSIVLLCILSLSETVIAQGDLGSPYSVFGPGLPVMRQSIAQAGMGGSGVALSDPYRLNLINPAAAASLTEPVFEFAGAGQLSTFQSNVGSFDNTRFVLNNFSMAFPIKRGASNFNFGLVPLTKVSYDFVSRQENEEIGAYKAEYRGDGGISQAYLGSALRIYQQRDTAGNVTAVSLGAQFNYNFGPFSNTRRITFTDDPTALGVAVEESFLVRDFGFELGAQFQHNIIKRTLTNPRYLKVLLGGVYRFGNDLNAERSNYAYTFRPSRGFIAPRDTLNSSTRVEGTVRLPQAIVVGFGLDYISTKRQRIRFAFDYSVQQWSGYEEVFQDQSRQFDFTDSRRISTGVEFLPDLGSSKILRRMEYRIGYRAVKTGIRVANTDVDDYGISFGLSLPVNYQRSLTQSRFSLAFEYGSFGTMDNGLVREDYVRIMAGFSLTPHFRNRWFVKPKYD